MEFYVFISPLPSPPSFEQRNYQRSFPFFSTHIFFIIITNVKGQNDSETKQGGEGGGKKATTTTISSSMEEGWCKE